MEEEVDFELEDIQEMFTQEQQVQLDNRVEIFENSNEIKKIARKHTRRLEK